MRYDLFTAFIVKVKKPKHWSQESTIAKPITYGMIEKNSCCEKLFDRSEKVFYVGIFSDAKKLRREWYCSYIEVEWRLRLCALRVVSNVKLCFVCAFIVFEMYVWTIDHNYCKFYVLSFWSWRNIHHDHTKTDIFVTLKNVLQVEPWRVIIMKSECLLNDCWVKLYVLNTNLVSSWITIDC